MLLKEEGDPWSRKKITTLRSRKKITTLRSGLAPPPGDLEKVQKSR